MKLKGLISKKLVRRLFLFGAVIGIASLFDIYLDRNPVDLDEIQSSSKQGDEGQHVIYIMNQATNIVIAKSPVQKIPDKKHLQQLHDKFLQKYHQLRNYQVFKAETGNKKVPFILSCHHLIFRDYYFSVPDDVPLIS